MKKLKQPIKALRDIQRKNKEKYQKRKNEGKAFSIDILTVRDQKMLKNRWRENAKKPTIKKRKKKNG